MKKVIAFLTIATITTITGCNKVEVSTNIEDFYLQSIIEQTEDISLEDAKKELANFEYEYDLQEYSKELSEEEKKDYEEEFGEPLEMPDMSFSTFSDEDSTVEIVINETDKKMVSSSYTKDKENIKVKIDKYNDICSLNISGDNVKYIEETISKLNLSKNTNEVVGIYFEIANSMKNNEDITIEDIIEKLDIEYEKRKEKRKEEVFGENYYIYDFRAEDGDTYIEVEVDDNVVAGLDINIGISDYTNYLVRIDATNENLLSEERGFNIDMNINSTLNNKMFDKSQDEIREAYKPVNKELFEFAYRDGKLEFYTDEYDEDKTDIIEGRYNKEEEAYVVIPNETRVVSELLYGIDEKSVTMKLNKYEKINLEINTEKEIGKSISITLIDESNSKIIFKEEIDVKNKNTILTEQVNKDGKYKVIFGIDNIDDYNIKISAIKTN